MFRNGREEIVPETVCGRVFVEANCVRIAENDEEDGKTTDSDVGDLDKFRRRIPVLLLQDGDSVGKTTADDPCENRERFDRVEDIELTGRAKFDDEYDEDDGNIHELDRVNGNECDSRGEDGKAVGVADGNGCERIDVWRDESSRGRLDT